MHSPRQVILVARNIKKSYWQLVCQFCGRVAYVTKADLRAAAELVVMRTDHHELFHFCADVLRQLFGSTHDALIEGALANAWARQAIIEARGKWQTKIGRMNGLFYRLPLDEAFNYQSPGYRDWPHYADLALGVTATLFGSSIAAAADVSTIELRPVADPTEAERAAEAEGRIEIYDGLTDRDIQEAMNEEFERVENMMFMRTRKTDTDGALKRNEDTGEVEVEDDGC